MKFAGVIEVINVKVNASGDVVPVVKLIIDPQADIKPLHDLLQKPLSIDFTPTQLEFGTGRGPRKRGRRAPEAE